MERARRSGRLFAFTLGLALGAASLATGPASANTTARSTYIVTFVDGTDARAEAARMRAQNFSVSFVYEHVFPGMAVELPAGAAEALARNPRVARIEPDGIATISADVTQTGATWGLDRIDQQLLPLDSKFTYPTSPGSGVRAYILDTGILSTHQEFTGRIGPGQSYISDGRGTEDCNGHGTHVAGTVGGTRWGVAKAATLVAVRVLNCSGSGSWSGIIAGLDWVRGDVGSPKRWPAVVNMSLGGGASSSIDTAVTNVVNAGITVVVAAGNSNRNACNFSPARAPAAVTVGATTSSDYRASYSNYGSCLDIFAPGSSITSAWYTGTNATNTISGTSMASPHVAGVVAVLLGQTPTMTTAEVAQTLATTATLNRVLSAGKNSPNLLLYIGP